MKEEKKSSRLSIMFTGIVIGMVIVWVLGAIISYYDPGTELTRNVKKFGDIKIQALEPSDSEEDQNIDKIMLMRKNRVPFLYAETDKFEKVTNIAITAGQENVCLSFKTSDQPGKWKEAIYGSIKDHNTVRELYYDINFDGQFDGKRIFNAGQPISRQIHINGIWVEVEGLSNAEAIAGEMTYIFDPNSGWEVSQ